MLTAVTHTAGIPQVNMPISKPQVKIDNTTSRFSQISQAIFKEIVHIPKTTILPLACILSWATTVMAESGKEMSTAETIVGSVLTGIFLLCICGCLCGGPD